MSETSQNILIQIQVFFCFQDLPEELRRYIWYHVLPGPRIVYVQRHLSSGQDAEEEERESVQHDSPLSFQPTYFMSPTSSDQIVTILRVCRESRSVAKENYTLLFPMSSTWFSLSKDFLYLDFGKSPHTLLFRPRDFTISMPERSYLVGNQSLLRYIRPAFDEQLAGKVENLVIATSTCPSLVAPRGDIDEFRSVFKGVKVLVIADQLHNMCSEAGEVLIWMRGQLGDEINASPLYDRREESHELEREKACSQSMRNLLIWEGTGHVSNSNDAVEEVMQILERSPLRLPLTIIRKSITTANIKKRLLAICGSEDNLEQLNGLNLNFVRGHKYHGSLNPAQVRSFLEMALERQSISCIRRPGRGCYMEECLGDNIPELLDKIAAL